MKFVPVGAWRNGSASDSRSEGWVFESLRPHTFLFLFLIPKFPSLNNSHSFLKILMWIVDFIIDRDKNLI